MTDNAITRNAKELADFARRRETAEPHGCDCCDPTSPSPDPVVVRLERENETLRAELTALSLKLRTDGHLTCEEELDVTIKERDAARERLAAAEAALNLSTDERQTAEVLCEELEDKLAAAEAERDECRRLLREAVRRCGAWNGSAEDWENFKREAAKAGGCDATNK